MVYSYTNPGRGTRALTVTRVSNIVHYTVRMLITTAPRARLLKVTMGIHVNDRSDSDDAPPLFTPFFALSQNAKNTLQMRLIFHWDVQHT